MKGYDTKTEFYDGIKKGIPIGIGYLAVSFTFGIWAVEGGIPLWITVFISLSNVTSAGQFAGVNLMFAMADFLEIGLSVFVINIRYMLMSLALTQKLSRNTRPLDKLIWGFGITDEVFAVASTREKEVTSPYMYGLILTPILGWTLGTFLGAAVGSILPERLAAAMGIALYAMFIAIIIPPAKHSRPILITVLVGTLITCVIKFQKLVTISDGFTMIIATVVTAAAMALLFPREEEENE
ncbi:MAG: AzlC family ABC transporter permease [Lachnospiraceae bacterium]|nr:AzlC family ABC transporter permease [Lachnospiraceae bacterium]